jgi:hypothetical protein
MPIGKSYHGIILLASWMIEAHKPSAVNR